MSCARCPGVMVRGRTCDLLDDSGTLNVSAWRCVGCGDAIEEIVTSPRNGGGESLRIRYAVRPCVML